MFIIVKVKHRASLSLAKPDECCAASQIGNKVEYPGDIKFHQSVALDMARVSHVKDS